MGWPRQSGDPHAEGPGAPASESNPDRGEENPLLPPRLAPVTSPAQREEAAPPRTPGQSKPGQRRDFALPLRRWGSKARGGRQRASCPRHQPYWGFPFPPQLRERREREEKEALPLRRAKEGRGHTGAPTTCQERSAPPPRRAGRGRGRGPGAGARTGAAGDVRRREHLHHRGQLHRRERLNRPEHRRHATDRPATTTPSPHREHRPATLLSSPPWTSSCNGFPSVETRRC
jgi:hypothetical protein